MLMTDEDLRNVGITKIGARKKLINAIRSTVTAVCLVLGVSRFGNESGMFLCFAEVKESSLGF